MNKELQELDKLFKENKWNQVVKKTKILIKAEEAIAPYYNILGLSTQNPTDEDLTTGEFAATVGDILLNLIDESMENEQLEFKTRNNDTE